VVEHEFPKIGYKKMILNARKIHQKGIEKEMILLAIEDTDIPSQ
jgi:two-component system CheB/CheR fusion protein